MPRSTAFQHTGNGFISTPIGVAGPAETWTLSLYIKNMSGFAVATRDMYFVSTRSAGGDNYQQLVDTPTIADGEVVRGVITGTTPALTTGVYILVDALNGTFGTGFFATAVQYEQVGSVGAYFDGDSTNAAWDGTNGNSASTETT
jgi:hypothetical protein